MKFQSTLLAVRDVERSKRFYQDLFDQEVVLDYGENVTFSGGFAIQEDFAQLTGLAPDTVLNKPHNMELYFETEDLDGFLQKLAAYPGVEYLHPLKQHAWQQHVVRIYDPDGHIIEIGEPMRLVVRRCLSQGKSLEETARLTQQSLSFVRRCQKEGEERPQQPPLLIDVEMLPKNAAVGFILTDEDGSQLPTIPAGKTVSVRSGSEREQEGKIYDLCARYLDLSFFEREDQLALSGYPVPMAAFFAADSQQGYFCSLGGPACITEEHVPIYYIDSSRRSWNLADNFRDFLSLLVFHPQWRSALRDLPPFSPPEGFAETQRLLQELFALQENPEQLRRLADRPNELTLYASKEAAAQDHSFADMEALLELLSQRDTPIISKAHPLNSK